MIYTRQEQWQFLEDELIAQTESFKQKLETSATFLLLEREELFVAQFLNFEDGEMILKFSNKRGLPRKGEYLYCFTVPKELRDFRNWGDLTYGDLIKKKGNFTEAVCIWQAPLTDNGDFCIAGFRGIELDFSFNIQNASGMILVMGPNKPPYEYIINLQKIVLENFNESSNKILDKDLCNSDWQPILVDNKNNISEFILKQLSLNDTLILQGPPGTGKTYQIAEICEKLCRQGKSVLATALTNRALIEIADKPALAELLKEKRIFKTKLSTDEAKDIPNLVQTKEICPQPGNLVLSTFYITSGEASNLTYGQQFDFVIVDEASQALLAMFAAAKLLGKNNLWIGDIKQLPPVVSLNEDKINRKNFGVLVDGLKALVGSASVPTYQLTETHRLPARGASYTGLFYNNSLNSKARNDISLKYSGLSSNVGKFFHPNGGPTLIKTDLEIGSKKAVSATKIAIELVSSLLSANEKLHISVLTYYVETTKALQKAIYHEVGYHRNLLIETVSRVQGLTTDVTIFVIPNTGYNRSLEKRLFNVATSRSKRHTLIITDKDVITSYSNIDDNVKLYLQKLNEEFSFYISQSAKAISLTGKHEDNETTPTTTVIDRHLNDIQENTPLEFNETKPTNNIGVKVVGKIDISKFEKQKKEIKPDKENLYIIDTNVFVDYPDIISKISTKYPVILSAKVLDELDKLKITMGDQGKSNIQRALRTINATIDKRDIRLELADLTLLPNDFNKKSPDNFILSVAIKYKTENPILLTSDNGLQIKAKGLNISTISLKDFLKQSRI